MRDMVLPSWLRGPGLRGLRSRPATAPEDLSHGVKGLEDNSVNRDKRSFFKYLCNIPPTGDME